MRPVTCSYVTIYEVTRAHLQDQPVVLRELVAGGMSSFVSQACMHRHELIASSSRGWQTLAVPIDVVSQSLMLQGQPGHPATHTAASLIRNIYATEVLRHTTHHITRAHHVAGPAGVLPRVRRVADDVLPKFGHLVACLHVRAAAAAGRCDATCAHARTHPTQTPPPSRISHSGTTWRYRHVACMQCDVTEHVAGCGRGNRRGHCCRRH